MKHSLKTFSLFVTGMVLAASLGQTAFAEDLPGSGKTVRYAQSDSLGANYVVAQIGMAAMKELGYDVKLSTLNTTLFFQAAAQGDLDIATDINFPQREPGYKKVEAQAEVVGGGLIQGGGINGYLIDKKTADANNITTLDQMKDPKIAALFGTTGKADLINCDPGWSCGDVVDFQLEKFGLKGNVNSVRGKYEALMVEAVARVKRGEPVFFYAWSPSWMNKALVPGKDVVWLPTPFDALPEKVPNKGSALVPGVSGCAGGADPCRMAMAAWNWNAVANREFIAANPAVKKLVEQMSFPLADWSTWEQTISEKGGSDNNIKKLAHEWIETHQEQFNAWVDRAKIAS
ncbi:proline/glycine betaine ABC transporter substrate-binding protein ProX [Mesorhizobium sp. M4A.F.Ca.ET.020.02.1.1]|uniref:glycine betaine/L-proline ABC transporter substrate-binding protein ProX n=1 Tax=unclassified Mesorhizobium TaxID=325217 RepID=UPI000FD4706B|nr:MULTISPECIES: glycine betaine/L-proline ABC transporter substrate-binding protein ProX [unclassified Mesorhizobium]RVD41143.1 proline/glycine betaine ABC transporter substrate-binding protein ProX [Mesorhizobium sp. M4A.F.Ca.ET.020.02.1.1]RWC20609.1 MAG: proline/glycine betaine ABC transporter substrate-binding protein ProX [Mesorhizobium sp.]